LYLRAKASGEEALEAGVAENQAPTIEIKRKLNDSPTFERKRALLDALDLQAVVHIEGD